MCKFWKNEESNPKKMSCQISRRIITASRQLFLSHIDCCIDLVHRKEHFTPSPASLLTGFSSKLFPKTEMGIKGNCYQNFICTSISLWHRRKHLNKQDGWTWYDAKTGLSSLWNSKGRCNGACVCVLMKPTLKAIK